MRIVTLNIWQEQGPWERRMEAIHSALETLAPDMVCLQEVREVPQKIPNQAETLADALGMEYAYEVAQPWGGGDEGIAILSRLPIAERASAELPFGEGRSRRVALGARVEWAPNLSVWVFTTHLAYRLRDGALREAQVVAVDRFIEEQRAEGETVVLCGDFNAVPESDEIRYLKGLTTLEGRRSYYQDAYGLLHPNRPGITWSSENPYTEAMSFLPRDRRLDYIFVSSATKAGRGRIYSCDIVCNTPDSSGIWPSDHYGIVAVIDP